MHMQKNCLSSTEFVTQPMKMWDMNSKRKKEAQRPEVLVYIGS